MDQILTEEELDRYEREFKNSVRAKAMYESDHSLIEEIIESHRALFVANAELSFKNMNLELENEQITKYGKLLESLLRITNPKALEELE